jgi:hypothetical protein
MGLLEGPVAVPTDIAQGLGRLGLRPLIEEHNAGSVDDVSLNTRAVYQLGDVVESDNIMIHVPPNLYQLVTSMPTQAVLAYCILTIYAKDVPLILLRN